METPLISIIIPAYNIDAYISRCLDSILNQSYKNLEIIVVNDGSTDKTGEILDEYKERDSRIRIIHKGNTGVSDTRNTGIDVALGEYIGFVDGDDTIHPDMYHVLMDNALKYHADISHCGYQMVFLDRKDDYHGTGKLMVQDNYQGVYDLLEASLVEPGLWNKLYRRDLIGKYRLDKNVRINEDLLFNYEMFKRAKCSVFEDKMLYYYMVRPASASTQKLNRNKILDPIKVMKIIMDSEQGECRKIAEKRYLYLLEKFCIQDKKEIMSHISEAEYLNLKKEAKICLKETKKNDKINGKSRLQATMAIHCPWIYRMIYKVYDLKHKSSKKYQVNA